MDLDGLQPFVQASHLRDEALARYRQAFVAHPMRLVWIKEFLQPALAERLSRFLATEAEFLVEHGLYSVEEGAVPEAQWLAADDADRFFRLRKVKGTAPEFRLSRNALSYVQFRQAFQRPDFRQFFESISGLALSWSDDFGAHAMFTGDFLRPHSDDNRNRQLALVIYLSPDWDARFGGALHVVDREGHETVIHPEYNSLIAFDVLTDTHHLVTAVGAEAGSRPRLTIGGWYHRVGS